MEGIRFQAILLVSAILFHVGVSIKEGQTCLGKKSCSSGLICDSCTANGNFFPKCIRTDPYNPTSKVKGLPFNKYSWLTTHNSFTKLGEKSATGSVLVTMSSQQDTISDQLGNGVRGLMLNMYDFRDDIWLCNSPDGKCSNTTAVQSASIVLEDILEFLKARPTEIITIIIEDYVQKPNGLTELFKSTGLKDFLLPVSQMPKNGDWPIVSDMINQNQRLVVFTSNKSKEDSEGFAYQWNYMVENQDGNDGMKAGSCPKRNESSSLDTKSKSLFFLNHYPSKPQALRACRDNSSPLKKMIKTCYEAAGQRWPNFVAVDFYKKSDGGGAAAALDEVNGLLICGSPNIETCEVYLMWPITEMEGLDETIANAIELTVQEKETCEPWDSPGATCAPGPSPWVVTYSTSIGIDTRPARTLWRLATGLIGLILLL